MMIGTQFAIAVALLGVAAYAQYRIAFQTARLRGVVTTRLALAVVGAALGYVLARSAATEAGALLTFVQGFGLVHVPAALILLLKHARGEAPS